MRLTREKKRVIRAQIEEALLRYDEWKRGERVPDVLRPYLDILEEVDAVGAYVSGKSAWAARHERKAVMMFLGGSRIAAIGRELRKDSVGFDELHAWLYGDETRDGIISAMYVKFVEMNKYCPFCDSLDGRGGQSKGASYPLTGKTCPHREMEEEGGD